MRTFVGVGDDALVESLMQLIGSQRRVMSEILLHLSEIEAPRIHLRRGYRSLFEYCVEGLGFSDDEACRRIDAARMARRFPAVLSMVAEGTVTLSVLGLLHPRLNAPHFEALLSGVKGMTVRRAKEWLAARFPAPDVPDSTRALPNGAAVPPRGGASVDPLSSDRFSIKVTVSRRIRDKLELARDLVRHKHPSGALEDVLEMALDALLESVSRKKFGATRRQAVSQTDSVATSEASRRYVGRKFRREAVSRDGLRCSYVAPDGRRCTACAFLEFDHVEPVGLGGRTAPEKIRILCRAHNRLAAEDVFGKEYVATAIHRAQVSRRNADLQRRQDTKSPAM